MESWLLIAAAVQAVSAANPGEMRGLAPVDIGQIATGHALDFRLKQDSPAPGPVRLAVIDLDGTLVVSTEWTLL